MTEMGVRSPSEGRTESEEQPGPPEGRVLAR